MSSRGCPSMDVDGNPDADDGGRGGSAKEEVGATEK
jgi:hypothetical protein